MGILHTLHSNKNNEKQFMSKKLINYYFFLTILISKTQNRINSQYYDIVISLSIHEYSYNSSSFLDGYTPQTFWLKFIKLFTMLQILLYRCWYIIKYIVTGV